MTTLHFKVRYVKCPGAGDRSKPAVLDAAGHYHRISSIRPAGRDASQCNCLRLWRHEDCRHGEKLLCIV